MPLKFFASDIVMKENTQDGMEGVLFSLEFFLWFLLDPLNQTFSFYAGELFFITDRNKGFWNIYKWVLYSVQPQAFIFSSSNYLSGFKFYCRPSFNCVLQIFFPFCIMLIYINKLDLHVWLDFLLVNPSLEADWTQKWNPGSFFFGCWVYKTFVGFWNKFLWFCPDWWAE